MVSQLSNKIVDFLIHRQVILPEQKELYLFGTEQSITTAINLATTFGLGLIFGELYQSVLFLVSFMVLRSYSGGYHASTPVKCYLLSLLAVLASLSAIKFIAPDKFICIGLLCLSGLIVFQLSPVDTPNKPLDEIEEIIYRQRSLIVWFVETVIALAALCFQLNSVVFCIVWAQVLVGIALVLGQLQKKKT